EDDAAHLRVLQAFDVVGRELEAGDVDEDRAEAHQPPSSTTNAMATPPSSVSEMCMPVTPSFFRCFSMGGLASMPGLPLALRVTVMLCHVNGAWIPVPIALANASLAAKRFARWPALSFTRA